MELIAQKSFYNKEEKFADYILTSRIYSSKSFPLYRKKYPIIWH